MQPSEAARSDPSRPADLLGAATGQLLDETQAHLQRLLRFVTVNPPGNEAPAIAYLADVLRREGLQAAVLESAPGRANLICRIAGRDSEAPLLLASHIDVVEVERETWTRDPFGGEIFDGCIWGRGAIDMKGKTAMDLAAMIALARLDARPERDVTMVVVADEEEGCHFGSGWLAENHPDMIRAAVCLNEVGAFTMPVMGVRYYPIQVAEKGMCWLRLTVRGEAGHGSLPRRDSAPIKLARAIAKLGSTRLPLHVTPEATRFIEALAAQQSTPIAIALRGLTLPYVGESILDYAIRDQEQRLSLDAILRNTVSPTVIRAGSKTNVIPGVAMVELDGRTVPGQSAEDLIREVRAVVGDEIDIDVIEDQEPVVTSCDTPEYETLVATLKTHDPEGVPVPWLIPGFTDDKFYAALGARCYGFAPLRLPPGMSFASMFHGANERVPVEGYRWGVRTFLDAVGRLAFGTAPER